jgi:hypothetical protein
MKQYPPPLPPYNALQGCLLKSSKMTLFLSLTIIFLFAAFGPMRDVCGRIAVFEENVVADEGNCIFLCFETSVGETKKHAVSP